MKVLLVVLELRLPDAAGRAVDWGWASARFYDTSRLSCSVADDR